MPTLKLSDGAELYYEVDDYTDPWRQSETVLLHHAAMGSSKRFYAWVPTLARHYRVLRFDARGHGHSTVPPANYNWKIERLVADVRELLDALKLERVHLAGSSAGGIIAQKFALAHPERLLSLALFATKPGMKHSNNDYGEWIRQIGELGLRGFLAKSAPDRFNVDQLPPGFLDWFLDESGRTSVPALARFVPLMASIDTRPDLGKIQVPTLIVAPGDDPLTPLEYVRPFVDSIPDARLVVFEGMRHNITDGVPERCAAELLNFLLGVSAGA